MQSAAQKLMRKRGGKPITVLIVDDEDSVRNVFKDFCLSSPLFEVVTASGGQEAIDIVNTREVDVITIDLVMPEISGVEAIATIKRNKPHVPVVIVTGNATDQLISEAGRLGGCRVMHKPVGVEEFLTELTELVEEKYG